jgi:trimeric autotransporter adhesin
MKTSIFTFLFTIIALHIFSQEILLLKSSGKVVIGDTSQITTPGNYNLYVQNGILTERVKVSLKTTSEWSDGAFDNTPDLNHVAMSIDNKRHLIEMPSASDLVNDGYELKAMDAKLLQQIEWLWQHLIKLDEENKLLKAEILALKQVHIPNKK